MISHRTILTMNANKLKTDTRNYQPRVFPCFPFSPPLLHPAFQHFSFQQLIPAFLKRLNPTSLKSCQHRAKSAQMCQRAIQWVFPSPETQDCFCSVLWCSADWGCQEPSPSGKLEVTLGRLKQREKTWVAFCIFQPFSIPL